MKDSKEDTDLERMKEMDYEYSQLTERQKVHIAHAEVRPDCRCEVCHDYYDNQK